MIHHIRHPFTGLFTLHTWLLLSLTMTAQPIERLDDENIGHIVETIDDYVNNLDVTGVAVGIIYNGKVAYTGISGLARTFPEAVEFGITTKSLLASVSKTITGILAMRMIADGTLGLDVPIETYIEGFDDSDITIRHLLSHQSGIAHYDNCPGGYDGPFDAEESRLVVADCEICVTPPGSGKLYTTFGNTLLGVIIDVVGNTEYGMGFSELYEAWIRQPGDLTTLTPEHDNSDPLLAQGHLADGVAYFTGFEDLGWRLPAGGFISDITDLAKYGAGIMNYTFLDSATSESMWVAQGISGDPDVTCQSLTDEDIGLSIYVSGSDLNLAIQHNGSNSNYGYRALLYLYPHQKKGFVILINKDVDNSILYGLKDDLEQYVLCPASRTFSSAVDWTGSWVYESDNTIIAESAISVTDGSFIFDAGDAVTLKPGFTAPYGSDFRAVSDGCQGSITPY